MQGPGRSDHHRPEVHAARAGAAREHRPPSRLRTPVGRRRAGGAGYLGSLNVLQTKNWKEFNDALPKRGSSRRTRSSTPTSKAISATSASRRRRSARTGTGCCRCRARTASTSGPASCPFDKLPKSLNGAAGFYNSSNNDVVPKIVPGYTIPLGYEYSAPYRYDRVHEVLSEKKKFSAADMERLQQDVLSLPARELVPLLKNVTVTDPVGAGCAEAAARVELRARSRIGAGDDLRILGVEARPAGVCAQSARTGAIERAAVRHAAGHRLDEEPRSRVGAERGGRAETAFWRRRSRKGWPTCGSATAMT